MAAIREAAQICRYVLDDLRGAVAFARRASTLDRLTAGRFGCSLVTSCLPNAARNFECDA